MFSPTRPRFRFTALIAFLAGGSSTLCFTAPLQAQNPGLRFKVTARFLVSGTSQAPQNVAANVTLSGNKARIEMEAGNSRSLLLYSPIFIARLIPTAKAGVRWKVKPQPGTNPGGFDLQNLIRDPSRIRAAILQKGAKKTGEGVLQGAPVEIYTFVPPDWKSARIWLRNSDALPVRLEGETRGVKVIATWRDYARLANVSTSLFQIPTDFKMRTVKNPPFFPGL